MRIAVVGAGYVGLSSALVWSHLGHEVRVLDRDAGRIALLRRGEDPLDEPLLPELLANGQSLFTTDAEEAYGGADVAVIAVGTPPGAAGAADLGSLWDAAGMIARTATPCPVLIRSTVPVGTADRLQRDMPGFRVISNPEFLREGSAVADTLRPDRIVAGGAPDDRGVVEELYGPILCQDFAPVGELRPLDGPRPLCWMDRRSSELAKYASNAFLATKLSFVNELANLAAVTGSDVRAVTAALAADPRIGPSFLRPGIGWGGSCFPKDTRALAAFSLEEGYDFTVLRAVIEQNNLQLPRFFRMMERELSGHHEPRIALLGLAFKSGTADCRESPAVALARLMAEREWRITAYDPAVHDRVAELPAAVSIAEDIESAVAGADALVVATEWPEFAVADLGRLRTLMRGDLVFDGRCVIDPARAEAAGLRYLGICAPAS
jgi:UDPglucose 6-dehydrogenase